VALSRDRWHPKQNASRMSCWDTTPPTSSAAHTCTSRCSPPPCCPVQVTFVKTYVALQVESRTTHSIWSTQSASPKHAAPHAPDKAQHGRAGTSASGLVNQLVRCIATMMPAHLPHHHSVCLLFDCCCNGMKFLASWPTHRGECAGALVCTPAASAGPLLLLGAVGTSPACIYDTQ
jgi:hypothetical protein